MQQDALVHTFTYTVHVVSLTYRTAGNIDENFVWRLHVAYKSSLANFCFGDFSLASACSIQSHPI